MSKLKYCINKCLLCNEGKEIKKYEFTAQLELDLCPK